MVKLAVTFELGAECLLTVTAREMNTGRSVRAQLSARDGQESVLRRLGEATEQTSGHQRLATGAYPLPPGVADTVLGGAPPEAGAPAERPAKGGLLSRLRKVLGRGPRGS